MVFDASSWSLTHTCHVGNARLVKKKHGRHTKFSLVLSRSYDKAISFLSKSVKKLHFSHFLIYFNVYLFPQFLA